MPGSRSTRSSAADPCRLRRIALALGRPAFHVRRHASRRRRPARLLCQPPRPCGPALHRPDDAALLAGLFAPAPARHRLPDALSVRARHAGRADDRLHAGRARRGELAVARPLGLRPRRADPAAAADCLDRPGRPRPCARGNRKPGRPARRGRARAQPRRTHDSRRAEPARALGPDGRHTLRPGQALQPPPALGPDARRRILAGALGRGALCPAAAAAAPDALGPGLGTDRRRPVAAFLRRARHRCDQAVLPARAPARDAAQLRPAADPAAAAGTDAPRSHPAFREADGLTISTGRGQGPPPFAPVVLQTAAPPGSQAEFELDHDA
ncbi:hypothetical protein BOSEA31B_12694 [Hyphomicrobiales bacterium]|nr:hypothetical protein BOSEA31B_12694 [Hyphomicrobiales bacterium]CAH1698462.1 hypothetical protein BOSEA1005_11515 [Hyphomicrobiales bacterium]CAI0342112.1 hypothetical protein BO1005MUT1_170068 [Hyphomicrobiales bacterium]